MNLFFFYFQHFHDIICIFLVRNYELDRSQIILNEIIGVGQFGDVHMGTYFVKDKPTQKKNYVNGNGLDGENSLSSGNNTNNDNKTAVIQVAVKTCKADDDPTKTEKFLQEACKCNCVL